SLISLIAEIIIDALKSFRYSLKYGKVNCRRCLGGARAGQPPGCLPVARPGGTGWSASRPGVRKAQAGAEYADVSFRPAARGGSRDGAARRSLDDLRGTVRNDECAPFLSP